MIQTVCGISAHFRRYFLLTLGVIALGTPAYGQLCTATDFAFASTPTLSPVSIAPGSTTTLSSFRVSNLGQSGADFSIGFYLSLDTTITTSDQLLGTQALTVLGNGSVTVPSTTVTVPTTTAPRDYYIGILLDNTNQFRECNEANNTASVLLRVTCLADLVISTGNPTATPTTVSPGETVALTGWTVKNQGTASTFAGFSNGFYLSTDSIITSSDTRLTNNSNAALAAGASFTWGGPTLTIPVGTAPGTYYVGILVDSGGSICESDENNNYVAVPITVSCLADLVVSTGAPTATPTTVAPGGTVALSGWTVKNQGGGTTGVGFSNGFYLSTDSVITTADTQLSGNSNAVTAAGGSFAWGGPTLTIPAATPPGHYFVGILVDSGNAVCESNHNNNYVSTAITVQCPPDLKITSSPFTATPTTVPAGGSVTLSSWTVGNVGTASTGAGFNNGFYLSTDSVITASDTLITGNSNLALAAGDSFTWNSGSITIPASTAPGTYYIGILVDRDNQICESLEGNNYVSAQITVTCGPDLAITTALTASPVTVAAGGSVTLSGWTVANQGTASTGVGFSNGFYLSTDPVITSADTRLTENSNNAMPAGGSFAWGSGAITIPASTPAGTYYIGILADYAGQVCESNETNNYVSTRITVTAACTTSDLVVSSGNPTLSSTSVQAGGTVTLSGWTVANQGTASTGAGFSNGFFLSTDTVITSTDIRLSTNSNLALAAGASFTWGGPTLTIPASTAPGGYYIGILVDYANDVCETNEGNNYVFTRITVLDACTTSDLVVSSGNPTVTPLNVSAGGAVTLSGWTVANQGTGSTVGGFSNGFYLSTDSVITTADTRLTENSNAALAGGASFTWGGPTLTIPGGTPAGTYYVGILVDYAGDICETNEGNNYVSTRINVQASCTNSDLTISGGGNTATPSTIAPGGQVTLSGWTVKNQGSATTGNGFNNGFYLSTDSVITSSDTLLTSNSNAALAAGDSFTWGGPTLTIPASTPAGTYYIGILVDRDNGVCETNETNNYVSTRIVVQEACTTSDLMISTALTATPLTVAPGGAVTLSSWTVKNQGTGSTGAGFSNGFYLSTDSVITTTDTRLTENSNNALAAGESFTWGGPTLTIPASVAPGTYYVGILVDYANGICETNESNNYVSARITVQPACTTSDLLVSSALTVSPTTVAPGGTVTLSNWTVSNRGTGSTITGFNNGFYLSTDSVIKSSDVLLDSNSNHELAAGASFAWGGPTLTIPPNTPPGNYYIGILVDRDDAICETAEGNNAISTPITVQAACASDLAVSGNVTVTPTSVAAGGTIKLSTWTVTNQGTAPTGSGFANGFYLSTDATITTADFLLDSNSNAALEARGSFAWGAPTLTIPASVSPGSYFVGILVDRNNDVCESNERNNFVSVPLTITQSLPVIRSFTPIAGPPGTGVTITGTSFTGATGVKFNGVSATFVVGADAQISTIVPSNATTGPITVTTPAGTATSTLDFRVESLPPVITSFNPVRGPVGTLVNIVGNHFNQTRSVTFNGAAATFTLVSDALITATVPSSATTGNIVVTAPAGVATSDTPFTVIVPAPIVAVAALPNGLLTDGSGGATDSYALVNRGTAPTTITLAQTGTFFTQSPSSFVLDPGATQKIILTANATAGGTFEGSSIPSGNGVPAGLAIPVKLLATPAPPGIPNVHPVTFSVQVVFPVSTGSVTLRNDGNGTAIGFLGTDVPWIAFPSNGLVEIAPGQSHTATFFVDRTKRLDQFFGSEVGVVRFIYRGTTMSGKTALDGTPSSTVSVTVVSVVPPNSMSTSIPPFAAGEVGLFIPAVPHKDNVTATVAMASALTQTSDVKLYFIGSGQSALNQVATLANLSPSLPRAMSDVVKNVFGQASGTGSFHVRSTKPDALALGAMLIDDSSGIGNFGTELSVFRSDQGAAAGQDVTLTGLRKDGSTHGDLFLQELSGAPTSVSIQFLDEQGRAIGAPRATDNLAAFGSLSIPNAIPEGAVSARITSSGGSGRFVAEAVEVDDVTKDAWNVIDTSRSLGTSRTEPVIIPLAIAQQDGNRSMQTDITISNPGSTTATARLVYYGPAAGGRRRAVRGNAHAKVQQALSEQSITLPPQGTVSLQDVVTSMAGTDSRGYFVLTPSSGEVVTTSRTAWKSATTGASFGTSTPPFAMTATASAGSAKRFVGIEDAGQTSVASSRPGTYRSSLNLIEAAGFDVTVRITLDYIYPLALVAVQDRRTRDVTVKAHELMQIDDLGQFVIGSDRALVSDLHNVTVKVEVVGGNGSVLPFVLATENSTGDLIFRAAN